MYQRKELMIFVIVIVASLFCSSSVSAVAVFTVPETPFAVHQSLRLRLDDNFTTGAVVRLARNTTVCESASTFTTYTDVPAGTISNVVVWTKHDSASSYWETELRPTADSGKVHVCLSVDNGTTWQAVNNAFGVSYFRVWKYVPHIFTVPQVATAGSLFRVFFSMPMDAHTKGVLVSNAAGCQGSSPSLVVVGGEARFIAGNTLEFSVAAASSAVFLCVSFPGAYDSWSLVAFDPEGVTTFREIQVPTGDTLESLGFPIYQASVRHTMANVSCNHAFIGGAHVSCTIEVRNVTSLPISPASVKIAKLTDGAGVEECPLPSLIQVTPTTLRFGWVPQRWGREGTLALLYNDKPLQIHINGFTEEYYTWRLVTNTSHKVNQIRHIPRYMKDTSEMKFFVQPPFSTLQSYSYTNLLSLSSFAPQTDWTFQDGVTYFQGRQNGTAAGEMQAASLKNDSTTGMMSQTITIPDGAERCRLVVRYYFTAHDTTLEVSANIGSVTLVAADDSADLGTIKFFTLYSLGRKVVVVTSGAGASLDGDIRTVEQLVYETPVHNSYKRLRVELEALHALNKDLYFLDPELKCTGTSSARTSASDIVALRRIYHDVGSASMLRWRFGADFNADPCQNHWQGVVCRHMRVVGLRLGSVGLSGDFPAVRELSMLEELDLSNNNLVGKLQVNNSRLREVDASRTLIQEVTVNDQFTFHSHSCLRKLRVANSDLRSIPASLNTMTALEELDLSHNRISSTLPNFDLLTKLRSIQLQSNYLTGALPELPLFPLVSADLSMNEFNGTIPATWGSSLKNAEFIDVSKNQLTGSIPFELSLIRTASKLVFRAEDNMLHGRVPSLAVKSLDVRNNHFQCPLPMTAAWVRDHPVAGLQTMQCDYSEAEEVV